MNPSELSRLHTVIYTYNIYIRYIYIYIHTYIPIYPCAKVCYLSMCQHSPPESTPPIHGLKASLFALGLDRSQGALQMCLAIASGDRKPLVDMTPTYMTPRCHVLFDKISSNLQEAEHWVVHCNIWWHMIHNIFLYTYIYCMFFKLSAKSSTTSTLITRETDPFNKNTGK